MKNTQERMNDWLSIVRAEFCEMPGLQLTKPQIQRLWGIEAATCDALVDALIKQNFLKRTQRGGYGRVDTH
jgi:hypothetical protein